MKFKFWTWKFLPAHILLLLLLFIIPAVFFVEYRPSAEMNRQALYIGLLIGGLSFPASLLSLIQLSQNTLHFFALSISIILLTSLFGWAAANGTVGFLANRLYGHEVVKTTEVLSKHSCKFKRKCLCDTEVQLRTDVSMSNGFLCVSDYFWNQIQPGDIVLLTGIESTYGFEIYDYKKH